jgi:hypothetical protein
METLTRTNEYQGFLRKTLSIEDQLVNGILHGQLDKLLPVFMNLSVLEAKAFKSKINSLDKDFENKRSLDKINLDFNDMIFIHNLRQIGNALAQGYSLLDNYDRLVAQLLSDVEKNRPRFYDVFFPNQVDELRNLILDLYPQTMPLDHYKDVFDLCGYFPNLNYDKINQLTMRRLQTFLVYKKRAKNIEIFESYSLTELSGILRENKVKDIVNDFWADGRLDNLEYLVNDRGGRLILDGNKVKIFELPTTETLPDGSEVTSLIYATPAFYSFRPGDFSQKQVGDFVFLDRAPRESTCIVEIDQILLRQDFKMPPADTSDVKFEVKLQVPVNLFKFYVKKINKNS